jgi:uncharacterized protein (DUF433 family)
VRPVTVSQRLPDYPEIHMVERTALGPRPVMVGTRLEVRHIVELVAEHAGSEAAAATHLEIDPAVVTAAMRYYRDHRDEVDGWIRDESEQAEHAYSAWRRAHSA